MQQSSIPPTGRPHASRFASYLFAALAFVTVGLIAPACSAPGTGGGDDCVGGVIINDVCEGKCSPDKCAFDNNTCVGNRCYLKCDSHADCYLDGSQTCVAVKEDDTDADINVCQFTGKPAGFGTACPFGPECPNWLACPDNGTCFASQCGNNPMSCVIDEAACKDQQDCTIGKCPDNTPCRVNCTVDCKPWLECETKGEADADAYCTKRDCMTDDDCFAGFYCGIVRDPHEVCGSNPQKGDNNFCGQTAEPCEAPGANGKTTFEGSLCMLRKSCLKRDQAAPCANDLDCSLIAGQACYEFAGERHCVRTCSMDADCQPDYGCERPADYTSPATPGADCGNGKIDAGEECDTKPEGGGFDFGEMTCTGLGFKAGGELTCNGCKVTTEKCGGACVPRFGAWVGAGGGFCEPCVSDEDCGTKGTTWACTELSGGMRACFDQSFPDTCVSNLDCPKSPSGKSGTCFDEGEGFGPGDQLYHRCYLPINASDNKTSCW